MKGEEIISFDLNVLKAGTLNKYIDVERSNRQAAARLKKRLTYYCRSVILKAMQDGVEFNWPCRLEFMWYLPDKRIDPDNWEFTQKFIFDGMQKAEINGYVFLRNDSVQYIQGKVHTYAIDKNNPRVEIREVE